MYHLLKINQKFKANNLITIPQVTGGPTTTTPEPCDDKWKSKKCKKMKKKGKCVKPKVEANCQKTCGICQIPRRFIQRGSLQMTFESFVINNYPDNCNKINFYLLESFCCKKSPNQEIGLGRFWEQGTSEGSD